MMAIGTLGAAFKRWRLFAGVALVTLLALVLLWARAEAQRADAATARQEHAQQQAAELTARLRAAAEYRVRAEQALAERDAQLARISWQLSAARRDLKNISAEVQDENWQACRAVVVPAALVERLRPGAAPDHR